MTKILSVADLSTNLVELDSHPGLEHLRRYSPTGVTAQRWAPVEAALGQLWEDVTELDALSDSDKIADVLQRLNAAYPKVKEFLDTVDQINATVAKLLAPPLRQLDATGGSVPKEVTDLLGLSASDPLSLTTEEIEQRIALIAELVELQTNWPKAIAETAARLDALRDAVRHAAQTRERATQKVLSGPLPVAADLEPKLRAALGRMVAPDPTALRELQRRIGSALQRVRQDEALAQGLLDRRTELKGRLKAYEAKTARLGLAEDAELLSARGLATGLLTKQPCDLRAATQAVVDYQQMVSAKREKTQ
jgi:hypothetical protein